MKFEMMETIQITLDDYLTDLDQSMVIIVQEVTTLRMMFELNNEEMALLLLAKDEKMAILISMMDEILIDRLKQDGHDNIM